MVMSDSPTKYILTQMLSQWSTLDKLPPVAFYRDRSYFHKCLSSRAESSCTRCPCGVIMIVGCIIRSFYPVEIRCRVLQARDLYFLRDHRNTTQHILNQVHRRLRLNLAPFPHCE